MNTPSRPRIVYSKQDICSIRCSTVLLRTEWREVKVGPILDLHECSLEPKNNQIPGNGHIIHVVLFEVAASVKGRTPVSTFLMSMLY